MSVHVTCIPIRCTTIYLYYVHDYVDVRTTHHRKTKATIPAQKLEADAISSEELACY